MSSGGVKGIAILVVLLALALSVSCSAGSSPKGREVPLPDFVRQSPSEVQEAYRFAVERPDILSFLPCYCGCVYHGDNSNWNCFIDGVDAQGTILFDPHGTT